MRMDHIRIQESSAEDELEEDSGGSDATEEDLGAASVTIGPGDSSRVKLCALHPATTLVDVESKEQSDRSFARFRKKFCEFLNNSLPTYGFDLQSFISLPADFKVCYRNCAYALSLHISET
jgi:hypothetical protein